MRHLLLLILLTISHFSFSQKQGQDSNTQQSVKVADTAKRTTNDTAKLLLKDSIVINNKDLRNSDLKIFIQQLFEKEM